METSAAAYAIERQKSGGPDWSRVTYCHSLEYARMIAAVGLQRKIGVSYRVIDLRTGVESTLEPTQEKAITSRC
jgi:hypothetical protein